MGEDVEKEVDSYLVDGSINFFFFFFWSFCLSRAAPLAYGVSQAGS